MIFDKLSNLIGYKCYVLDDEETLAFIETPYFFEDGRIAPIYVSPDGPSRIKFFDLGDVVTHFQARGFMLGKDKLDTTAIERIAKKYSIAFPYEQELEVSGTIEDSPKIFENFLKAIQEIMDWELEVLERGSLVA